MVRILLLFFALLIVSGVNSAEAARPSRYARAKMKGRLFVHRPYYKKYKGKKSSRKRLFGFRQKSRSSAPSYRVGRHSTR
ncbi:hypothetical protein [Hymenobacter weizhouensis]|uniref:hypothetical protein n=1 Tax=Hymenobacter sp. YIM 151500-1 TaxID=2987689 RepID=UPI002225DF51|nr:hypothetical protein [Hymenobacter sp. YIM 151500-1]UYZ63911.1 hypothetical protein OIS53_03480 [Hymenobacter sp. YIM 151500-1]